MANSLFNPIILFAMNRRIRNYIIYYLKFTCCLFGVHKRFSRTCHRSSMQIMMKKGASQLQYQKPEPAARGQMIVSNRSQEPNKHSHCRHKRCAYANSATNSDEESNSGRHRSSSMGSKRPNVRYVHQQEFSSSSVNSVSQSNHSYSTNKRFLLRKSPNRTVDLEDDSQWNHSCPPVLCSPREANSASSCSFCVTGRDRSNWHTICRCGSDSGPSARGANASCNSTYNSLSCANLDRLYSITQNDAAGRSTKAVCGKSISSRFRLFAWRSRRPAECPVHWSERAALSLTKSAPQRRSQLANGNDTDRINTAL